MSNETIATETTRPSGNSHRRASSDGITNTPPSFVRAILAAASDPAVTSFAGGLPTHLIPAGGVAGIDAACGGRARR
ncbi:MAG: hypothetical protein ACLSDQ_11145 [Adlercreutzia equolifaciens]